MTLRSLLVLALASTASCFSLQQPALVRGAAAAPLRPARSLRMQEEAPKEAAPTPVDFTPSPPAEEEEKKGFDPTQCVPLASVSESTPAPRACRAGTDLRPAGPPLACAQVQHHHQHRRPLPRHQGAVLLGHPGL